MGKTVTNSYGSRVKNSAKNIFLGFLAVILSISLLAWNENNFIKTKKSLNEGAAAVVEASATQIDSSLEGKEVHLYGETASSAEALKDEEFGIVVDDLKLHKYVEIYQYYENETQKCHDNVGGSETCDISYSYSKGWYDTLIDSSNFDDDNYDKNPKTVKYKSEEWKKSPITLGAYTLDESAFVSQLTNYTSIDLTNQNIIVPTEYQGNDVAESAPASEGSADDNNNAYLYGDIESTSSENDIKDTSTTTNNGEFHINGNHIYIGNDEGNPEIGDIRITFSSVKTGTVSVIGQQIGNNIVAYPTSVKGKTIALLQQGVVSAETMFVNAQQTNKMGTWIVRLIGLLLMYAGFAMMLELIETLAKVIPFLSRIIGVGTRLIAFCFTLVLGFLTIGIAWLAVRPVIGISCLAVAVAGIVLLANKKKGKSEDKPEIETKPEIINKPEE